MVSFKFNDDTNIAIDAAKKRENLSRSWTTAVNDANIDLNQLGAIVTDSSTNLVNTSYTFYDEKMLDYLLDDIIKKKAKEAEEKLKIKANKKYMKFADDISDCIDRVIFNKPATIIKWKSGDKTVVKCGPDDEYDPEKGFILCLVKHFIFSDTGYYNKLIKKWVDYEA